HLSGVTGAGASVPAPQAARCRRARRRECHREGTMIRLTKVSKSHDGGRTFAVRDVSLHVPEGELLALVGTAGCGKTTVLGMINRLSEPNEGTVEVGGRDVSGEDPVELRRKIGYVVQKSGLFPHMTVRQNIAVVPRLLGWAEKAIQDRVEKLVQEVVDPKNEG